MEPSDFRRDPVAFFRWQWPDQVLYAKQRKVVYAVRDTPEVYVPAANMVGKDYVSGFLVIWYFLVHNPVRIITTSVRADHLRVLWGEIGRFISTAKYPLAVDRGGPLVVNHWDIRKVVRGRVCDISYVRGICSERGEGLAGHHAAYTLIVGDEASGIDDTAYEAAQGWAKRMLWIGNPNKPHPGAKFFKEAVVGGDLEAAA